MKILQGDEFEAAVEILAAGAEVGARKSLVGEPGAVGAAADGHHLGRDAAGLHGRLGSVHDIHVRQDLLLHVPVALGDRGLRGARAVLLIEEVRGLLEEFAPALELFRVVVSDDIGELGLLHLPCHVGQVIKPFVAVGGGRGLIDRQELVKLHGQKRGVDHLAPGRAGMDALAVDHHRGRGGVEVLILDLTQGAAVHGIGIVGAKALHVEEIRASSHLLVGGEADAHGAVGLVRV